MTIENEFIHYKCRYCGIKRNTQEELYSHIDLAPECRRKYQERWFLNLPKNHYDFTGFFVADYPATYRCNFCRTRFYTNIQLNDHLEICKKNTKIKQQTNHPEGEDEEGVDGFQCIICLDKKPCIMGECKHLCVCIKCSKELYNKHGKCPKCRVPWINLVKVYV